MAESPNLVNLVEQLYPEAKNDGYMIHNIMKFFHVDGCWSNEVDRLNYEVNHQKAVTFCQEALLLKSLIERRFQADKLSPKPPFSPTMPSAPLVNTTL